MSPEQRIGNWRLRVLLGAYADAHSPLEEEELTGLCRLADSKADLHTMEDALRRGCSLGQALAIFL